MTILQFAETINRIVGNKAGITFVKDARSVRDPQQRQPDITRAREILSWEPKVSLEEGIHKNHSILQAKTGAWMILTGNKERAALSEVCHGWSHWLGA